MTTRQTLLRWFYFSFWKKCDFESWLLVFGVIKAELRGKSVLPYPATLFPKTLNSYTNTNLPLHCFYFKKTRQWSTQTVVIHKRLLLFITENKLHSFVCEKPSLFPRRKIAFVLLLLFLVPTCTTPRLPMVVAPEQNLVVLLAFFWCACSSKCWQNNKLFLETG